MGKAALMPAFSCVNQRNFPAPNWENVRFIPLKESSVFIKHLHGLVNCFSYFLLRTDVCTFECNPAQNTEPDLDFVMPQGICKSIMSLDPNVLFYPMYFETVQRHMEFLLRTVYQNQLDDPD